MWAVSLWTWTVQWDLGVSYLLMHFCSLFSLWPRGLNIKSYVFCLCASTRRCCLIKASLLSFTVSLMVLIMINELHLMPLYQRNASFSVGVLNREYSHFHWIMSSYCITCLFYIFASSNRSSETWVFTIALPFMWFLHSSCHSFKHNHRKISEH